VKEIEDKARDGYPQLRGLGEDDLSSLFDEFTLVGSSSTPILSSQSELDTEVIVGEGRDVKFPLLLTYPYFIDAANIGLANKSVRIAMAFGALLEKVPINIGYGMYPEEEKIAKKFNENFIMQWTHQRIGNDLETLSKAKAIVISLSYLSSNRLFNFDDFMDVVDDKGGLFAARTFGPQRHLDLETAEDLKNHVELIREATEYKLPVMVKVTGVNVYENTKSALFADCDAVIVDTSMDPFTTLSINGGNFGTSLIAAIPPALKAFRGEKAGKKGIKLFVTGGIRNGADIVKAMALGVDGVGLAESSAVALGCNLCGECFDFQCDRGMITRDESLKSRFKWKEAGKKLANFLSAIKTETEVLLDYVGVSSISELNEKHIMALTYDSAAISGVKLIGYDRALPMWFH
jgi:hypothetical protein